MILPKRLAAHLAETHGWTGPIGEASDRKLAAIAAALQISGYDSLLAAIRSATTLEGMLLEKGIALVAAANPHLVQVQLERPLPVQEIAKAVFRRNDWSKASGLRLDSEVVTREFYKPDLLLVDGARQLALIVDVEIWRGTRPALHQTRGSCPATRRSP